MFYTNCNPHQPSSAIIQHHNRATIDLYDQLHDVELDDDMDCHMTEVAALLGTSKHHAGKTFIIKYILDKLPTFKHLARTLGHLDTPHLAAVAEPLFSGVTDEHLPEIDTKLTDYLTPTREHQALPSPRKIKHQIKEWMLTIDPNWGAEKPTSDEHLSFRHDHDTTYMDGEFSRSTGKQLHDIIRAAADKDGVSMAQALINLITGQTTVSVTVNLYQSAAGTWLDGIGWLNAEQKRRWMAHATTTRNLNHTPTAHTERYRPTEAMKAYVRGRDGSCRFPNCHVEAEKCDIDHVVAYPQGPTAPSNLQCLCRHHHNMKTDGRIHAHMDEDGTMTWTLPNGTTITQPPTGPYTHQPTRWGTTLNMWIQRHTG